MRLTRTEMEILRQAELDGGVVELSGIDARSHYNKRHHNAAIALQNYGLGVYTPHVHAHLTASFTINSIGEKVLSDEDSRV